MAKWLSVHLQSKWLWVRILLLSLNHSFPFKFHIILDMYRTHSTKKAASKIIIKAHI